MMNLRSSVAYCKLYAATPETLVKMLVNCRAQLTAYKKAVHAMNEEFPNNSDPYKKKQLREIEKQYNPKLKRA